MLNKITINKKASGKLKKLKDLGLDDDEIQALMESILMAIIKPNNNTISAITALPAAITTGKVLQVVTNK